MNKFTSLGFAVLLASTSTIAFAEMNTATMNNGMSMGQGMGGMKQGMGGMNQGGCAGMSADKMQMRKKMQARVMEIQKEPELAKRQSMMKEFMTKMQAMMQKKQAMMQKRRAAMQA